MAQAPGSSPLRLLGLLRRAATHTAAACTQQHSALPLLQNALLRCGRDRVQLGLL
jgi:hypothetical protein